METRLKANKNFPAHNVIDWKTGCALKTIFQLCYRPFLSLTNFHSHMVLCKKSLLITREGFATLREWLLVQSICGLVRTYVGRTSTSQSCMHAFLRTCVRFYTTTLWKWNMPEERSVLSTLITVSSFSSTSTMYVRAAVRQSVIYVHVLIDLHAASQIGFANRLCKSALQIGFVNRLFNGFGQSLHAYIS